MDAPAAPSTAARFTSACSVRASMPSGTVPVAGSIPAMPEQETKPPATIAWLSIDGSHAVSIPPAASNANVGTLRTERPISTLMS